MMIGSCAPVPSESATDICHTAQASASTPGESRGENSIGGSCAPAPSKPPSRPLGSIHLVSFGLEELEHPNGPFGRIVSSLPGGGLSAQFSHSELYRAVRRARRLHVDAFADVRGAVGRGRFPNPAGLRCGHHVGFHPTIVAGLVNAPYFREWLGMVKRTVHNLYHHSSESDCDKTLALYCKSGRHRSVAAVFILKHCLRGELSSESDSGEGWFVTTSHVTLQRGRWRGCEGTCPECTAPHSYRECTDALEKARRLWVSL